jgi:DNA anti-recombination protein RmuC
MDWIIIGGLLIIIVMQILLRPKQLNNNKEDLEKLLNEIQRSFDRIEKNFREDFRLNREESRLVAKDNREELAHSMNEFREAFERGIDSFNRLQKEKFAALDERQQRLVDNTEKRLEEIRVTVDEKLQKTLNDRIGQSFRLVTEQLESVQKGLGEMQTLAQDVGGLKRVLSNVKTRGNIGEIQLSMLLEQLLAPEQYEANVRTRKGSDAVVEFAVKLPGRDDAREFVYLPIDAKFPKDVYEQLLDAYDAADSQAIETAGKLLETTIKKMAKDISDKYLAPPATTDFGIMFLPFEGIYAEVVRRSALLEDLQRQGSRNRSHYPSGHTKQFTNGLPYIGDPKALRGGMDDLRGREKRIRESRRYARESPKELANRQRANRRGFRYPYPCHPT